MDNKIFYSLLLLCAPTLYASNSKEQDAGIFYQAYTATVSLVTQAYGMAKNIGQGEQAMKQIEQRDSTVEQLTKTVEILSPSTKNSDEQAKAFRELTEAKKENNEILKDGFEKIKKESPLTTASQVVVVAGGSIYILKSGYDFYKFAYGCIWPNPEDQIRKETAIRQLRILRAETPLNECLAYNRDTDKDADGMPCKCREVGRLFEAAAGQEAFNKVRQAFNNRH